MNRREFLKTSLTVTTAVAGSAILGSSFLSAAQVALAWLLNKES